MGMEEVKETVTNAEVIREKFMVKATRWLKHNIINIIVFIGCLIFIAQYLGQIKETDKTFWEIISSGAIVFGFGFSIIILRGEMGFINGRLDPEYVGTLQAYGIAKLKITPYCEKLDVYCEWKNDVEIKRIQTEKLNSASLIYDSFIKGKYDEGIHPLTRKPLTEEQLKAVEEARNVKIERLTPKMLMSEYSNSQGGFGDLNDGTRKYRSKGLYWQAGKSIVTGLIGGFYTIQMYDKVNWGNIIWASLIIVFLLIMSFCKEVQNYQYVITVDRNRFIRKRDYLSEFYNMVTNNSPIFKLDTQTFPREDENIKDKQSITRLLTESTEGGDICG